MDPIKNLRSQLGQGIVRAWDSLTDGWRELLSRSSGALTLFRAQAKNEEEQEPHQDFPRWGLLSAETWETAHFVIVRVEIPGMKKEDFDISVQGNTIRIRGEKRSTGEHQGRTYQLMERAYGYFERTISLPQGIDENSAEVSYQDGVITIILRKTEASPPRPLAVP